MSTSQSNAPEGILCSKTHEWALEEDNVITIGLTDLIIEHLGDIVFVELPEVGSEFAKNEVFATIESVKAASEKCGCTNIDGWKYTACPLCGSRKVF